MSDQLSIDLTSEGAASQALAIPRGRNRASISVKQRGSYDATPWSATVQWALADKNGQPHQWNDLEDPRIGSLVEYSLDFARGAVPGISRISMFGRNPDIDTGSAPEDIWDGPPVWQEPTAPVQHDIASTDAADTAAGTGARTVYIAGLDAGGYEQNEVITLNGTTNVQTVGTYRIIYWMYVVTAGSGRTNAGTITATATGGGGNITAQIAADMGQSLSTVFQIPVNKRGYAFQWYCSLNRSGGSAMSADVRIITRSEEGVDRCRHFLGLHSNGTSYIGHRFEAVPMVAPLDLIRIQGYEVSANNTDIAAGYDMILVDESILTVEIDDTNPDARAFDVGVVNFLRLKTTTANAAADPQAEIYIDTQSIEV